MANWTRALCAILSFTTTYVHSALLTQPASVQPPAGLPGQFAIVGDTLVSAQQAFLGTVNTVFILDKAENNPAQIRGHPAWASKYGVSDNKVEAMDVLTNTFCAGGNVLGDGTWINVGGNQAVKYGGDGADTQDGSTGPYEDADGRNLVRVLKPCDNDNCFWTEGDRSMTTRRWYPTVETLDDGTAIILGGCQNGGYVNDAYQTNPTYEFYPSTGSPITSPILETTLPANLYPLTWLLPSGKLLIQSNWATVLLDYHSNVETKLDDIPDAVRTYPASAGTVMLPLTPKNQYAATVLFCGGVSLQPDEWTPATRDIVAVPTSQSCVTITPDKSSSYVQDDPLSIGLTMNNLILLPTGKILSLNGAKTGTAGYGNETWTVGMSYADKPSLTPAIYDPEAPAGSRWSSDGLSASTIPRLYHSTAVLLPDGSVFVAGSNPNSDYNVGPTVPFGTEYRAEKFYPPYFNERRPQPVGLPKILSYGGETFDIQLDSDDLKGDLQAAGQTTVVLIRTGFSTHAMNMGQRFLQLGSSWTTFSSNTSATIHVSQLPPNAAVFAPGPALLFVVVNGVPSVGVQVMVGSGQLEKQPLLAVEPLLASGAATEDAQQTSGNSSNSTVGASGKNDDVLSNTATLLRPWTVSGLLLGFLLVSIFR